MTLPAGAPGSAAATTDPARSDRSLTRFDRPVIILAAPRSGSSLLFETLTQSPTVYTVGGESHRQIEGLPELRPADRGYDSNRLMAADATPSVVARLRRAFIAALIDREGNAPPASAAAVRLLEKTPKNALRVPFFEKVFPDARYVYLYRPPHENISSMIEGWGSGRFVMYRELPGWQGSPWSYVLVPGWRELIGKSVPEIAAAQWQRTQDILLDDLAVVDPKRVFALTYRDFLADPGLHIAQICAFAGIGWDRGTPSNLPLSAHTVTPPHPDKWLRHQSLMAPYLPALQATDERARALVEACRTQHQEIVGTKDATTALAAAPQPAPAAAPVVTATTAPAGSRTAAPVADYVPVRSAHTSNLPEILRQLRASLLITTYQSHKLMVVRQEGGKLEMPLIAFPRPMGLCADGQRMLLGTETGIREFRNVPEVATRLQPPNRNDSVYLFRNHHVTGNIDIHEMALGDGHVWYVNTMFSCLCALDTDLNFLPVWKPRFITELADQDRCHLNGLAVVDGKPNFLTALGATDTPQGWRDNKKDGGVLIECNSREVIVRGLSMPHSPRWYRNKLWLLESGRGSLATIDLASGKVETVVQLPGFTRGLDFVGPLRLHRTIAVARQARVHRHSDHRGRLGTDERRVGGQHRNRTDRRLPQVPRHGARDLCRAGAERDALPRDRRRRSQCADGHLSVLGCDAQASRGCA